ncbi:ShlB/FhaC/HecB family hemolysin secretion/activation protein, partial [Xenorhabdus griffiniae]|uniref:ShlB/FhaC/HecB family hemolysin secretion/activation protein n=1 Tax=Xenorhabdus griffiniae TaxID=351672 RepID=UPI0023588F11
VFRRHSTNAVGNIEIAQQHRSTAGWELGLSQRSYFGDITLDAGINWRRGTGAFGAGVHISIMAQQKITCKHRSRMYERSYDRHSTNLSCT